MAEPQLQIIKPEDVVNEDHITVKLKRPITVEGVKYDFVKLRYPKKGDIKEMQRDKNASLPEQIEVLLCRISVSPVLTKESVAELAISDFAWIQQQLNESGFLGFKPGEAGEGAGDYVPNAEEVEDGVEIAPGVMGLVVPLKRKLTFNGLEYPEIKMRIPLVRDFRVMTSRKAQNMEEAERFNQLLLRIAVSPPLNPDLLDEMSQSDFIHLQVRLSESGFLGVIRQMT